MATQFTVFRMVLGLLVSGFILVFVANFAASYAQTQEDIQLWKTLTGFDQALAEAYLSGIPADYSFGRLAPEVQLAAGNTLETRVGKRALLLPAIVAVGTAVAVQRNSIDYGWWSFHYLVATPGARLLFSPDGSVAAQAIMRDIAAALPETETGAKSYFGFCSGNAVEERLCAGKACTQDNFLKLLASADRKPYAKCSAKQTGNYRLVRIAGGCQDADGLCIDYASSKVVVGGQAFPYSHTMDLLPFVAMGQGQEGLAAAAQQSLRTKLAKELAVAAVALRAASLESVTDLASLAKETAAATADLQTSLDNQKLQLARLHQQATLFANGSIRAAIDADIKAAEQRIAKAEKCLSLYAQMAADNDAGQAITRHRSHDLEGAAERLAALGGKYKLAEAAGCSRLASERVMQCAIANYLEMAPALAEVAANGSDWQQLDMKAKTATAAYSKLEGMGCA
ncbi:MAG: hypothetical protein HY519_04455 [Candidatus Aenigmarchaeota archaeon]|nr:hypothetical protein [Candidatus Aenigmarchaeota archaeon]